MTQLPDDIINKIIMYSIPHYPFLEDLKYTRFIRNNCDCDNCDHRHWYGCSDFIFNSVEHKRGMNCEIILFNPSFLCIPKLIKYRYKKKEELWVRVVKFENGHYYGTIRDAPISKDIKIGASVRVKENRVIDSKMF